MVFAAIAGVINAIIGMYLTPFYTMRDGTNRNETVRYKVNIDGNVIMQQDKKGLVRVSVNDHLDKVGMAEVVFMRKTKEQKFQGLDWSAFKVGSEVEVEVGGSSKKVFVGKVSGMRHTWKNGKDQLTLVCFDPTSHMAGSRKTRYWEDKTDSDVAKEVIEESGPLGKFDATETKREYILQRNESDYNFVKRLASRNGMLLKAFEGKIDFCKPEFPGNAREIKFFEMRDFDCERAIAEIPPELHVLGWNWKDKKQTKGTAGPGDIIPIGSGQNAVEYAAQQVWKENSWVVDTFAETDEMALEQAKADLNRIARGFIRGSAIMQGDGEIFCGQKVKFPKLADGHKAEVVVISASHDLFEGGGAMTRFHFVGNTKPQ